MQDVWMFFQQTLAASVTAFFLLFLQSLFRDKLSPRWQYTIWLVLLVRLLVPAGWGVGTVLDLSGLVETARVSAELKLTSAWSTPWSARLPLVGLPVLPQPLTAPVSVTDWLFLLYLAGVLACGAWLLLGWLGLQKQVSGAVEVKGTRLEQVHALALARGLKPPAAVVETRSAHSPFLKGAFRPVLVVPMGWQVEEKVVLHELYHAKNRDVLAGWVTALFRCVHWCNPFLWKVFDRIDNQREQRCDQQVLEALEGEQRRDYGRVLLSMADDKTLRVPGATTMANGARQISARVQAIARFKTYPQGMGLVSICMALILLPHLVFGFSASAMGEDSPDFTSPAQALAYAQRTPCTTVAAALDAYGKSVYHHGWSPYSALMCRAMVAPREELSDLLKSWDEMWADWETEPQARHEEMERAYRNGPMIRGLVEDGQGGYLCQMYFFRRGWTGNQADGVDWLRHTLALTKEGRSWKVVKLSENTGRVDTLLKGDRAREELRRQELDPLGMDLGERPVRYWKTSFQGVEAEIWSECYVTLEDLLTDGGVDMTWFSGLYATDTPVRESPRPHLSGFGFVQGQLLVHLRNTTDETLTVIPARIVQHWDDPERVSSSNDAPGTSSSTTGPGRGYAGGNAVFDAVELLPGASVTLLGGGGGTTGVSDPEALLLPKALSGILNVNGLRLPLEEVAMEVSVE